MSSPGTAFSDRTASQPLIVAVLAVALLAGVPAAPAPALAQQAEPGSLPNEYTVKAVFLYSFGRFVQWPAESLGGPSDPFVIGIVGEDSFGGALDEIASKKTVQERRIVVRRFSSPEQFQEPCHILFVSRSLTAEQQAAVLKKVSPRPVLIVGEVPGFAEQGAVANFFVEGGRVRFEINADNARRAQLRMDAKLLSLGKPVGVQRVGASN